MSKKETSAVLAMIQQKYPGYHPLMSIAEIAHNPDPTIDWDLRFNCHKTIAKFVEPELKSVQNVDMNKRPTITISMFGDDADEDIVEIANSNRPLVTVK